MHFGCFSIMSQEDLIVELHQEAKEEAAAPLRACKLSWNFLYFTIVCLNM